MPLLTLLHITAKPGPATRRLISRNSTPATRFNPVCWKHCQAPSGTRPPPPTC
jgi:hypothetical protein